MANNVSCHMFPILKARKRCCDANLNVMFSKSLQDEPSARRNVWCDANLTINQNLRKNGI